MQANRPSGTRPELALRRALIRSGLRGYRLNLAGVPGRPDIAFTKTKLAIFVHGCFWHRCPLCRPPMPKRNRRFWELKFHENAERDERTRNRLHQLGWATLEFWECEVAGDADRCALRVARWLAGAGLAG